MKIYGFIQIFAHTYHKFTYIHKKHPRIHNIHKNENQKSQLKRKLHGQIKIRNQSENIYNNNRK